MLINVYHGERIRVGQKTVNLGKHNSLATQLNSIADILMAS